MSVTEADSGSFGISYPLPDCSTISQTNHNASDNSNRSAYPTSHS